VLRNLSRDFHLHFQVLWLRPLLKGFVGKNRFSRGVLANTARFLLFFSLETLRFLAADGIKMFWHRAS